jgi:hypothetical protein
MGILIIWILLCGAYAWSAWNLAQMARSRVSWATPVASLPSCEVQQIEPVHPGEMPSRSVLAATAAASADRYASEAINMMDVVSIGLTAGSVVRRGSRPRRSHPGRAQ